MKWKEDTERQVHANGAEIYASQYALPHLDSDKRLCRGQSSTVLNAVFYIMIRIDRSLVFTKQMNIKA